MDKANPTKINAAAGISIRNGPVEEIEVNKALSSTPKRKARESMVNGNSHSKISENEDDDKPLVGHR